MSRSLKQKFVVQKIKNNQLQTDKPPKFKSLPELYLQLITNGENNLLVDNKLQQYNQQQQEPYFNNSLLNSKNFDQNFESSDNYEDSRSEYSDSDSDSDNYEDSRSEYSSSSESSHESNLSTRLKDILKDDGNNLNSNIDNKNNIRNNYNPPTLQELENRGEYTGNYIPNVGKTIQQEEEEEDKKRELLFKFELLKKSYKNTNIPELTIHTDLKTIENTYEDTVKRLNIENNVESYRNYLIGGFMVVEYGLGHFLKFDMKGFTQQQMVSMNGYNKLLVELGEKTYKPKAKKMSVELRLLFLIMFNAATFVISKMILKGTGSNLMGMLNNLGKNVTNSSSNNTKRK